MKRKNCISGVISAIMIFLVTVLMLITDKLPINSRTEIDFTESTEIIQYPDCGCTSTKWIKAFPGEEWSADVDSYSLLLINIGGYSSGMSSADCELDSAFFRSLENTFKSASRNGAMVGIRFRYDENGTEDPEPSSFELVLRHIDQIGESGLLTKYSHIISFIESGMVGKWGEQWGGKYTSTEYKSKVLDSFLNIVPDPIPVTVRTPDTFRQWIYDNYNVTISAENMGEEVAGFIRKYNVPKAARVGLYNDGYMGSHSDLGTYSDRNGETDWIKDSPVYGGEFSSAHELRMKYTTWQPENAISEMYKTGLTRINSNIYKDKETNENFDSLSEAEARLDSVNELYRSSGLDKKDYSPYITDNNDGTYCAGWKWLGYDSFIFDKELSSKLKVGCNNTAFYGQNCYDFIKAHLGYRFVIRHLDINVADGNMIKINFITENTGFADSPTDKAVDIILKNNDTLLTYQTSINAKNWKSAEKTACTAEAELPGKIACGEWEVYIRISCNDIFGVRLANEGIKYSDELGANLIGYLTIAT